MSTDQLKVVGASIRNIRRLQGMSQEKLAEVAGFHYTYIGGVERGQRNISLSNLFRMAAALDVPIHELFSEPTGKRPETPAITEEIIALLLGRTDKEKQMALKIIKEVFKVLDA